MRNSLFLHQTFTPLNSKVKIARLSVASNIFLVIMKFIVGMYSGSVSIISEAMHSVMDLIAALIAFFSVRISDNPPDEAHPYGHGKYENVSGVVEALLILLAAVWIIYEAIHKILVPSEINDWGIGIGAIVMLVSAAVNFYVSRKLYKVAKATDSIALEADALHLKADVFTSLGVGIGLFFIWITDYHILDPVIAILVALFILKESFQLLNKAFNPLLDSSLTKGELDEIMALLHSMDVKFHEIKTRKAGNQKFVDFHLEMPPSVELSQVHLRCDEIEKKLEEKIAHLHVNIHVEPLGYHK